MNKKLLINSLVMLALIAIIVYVISRTILVAFADYAGVDKFTSILLLLGEFFIIIHGIGYTLNIYRAYKSQKDQEELQVIAKRKLDEEPSVAVLVAARHEPKEILQETFRALKSLRYKNKQIYLLDDSTDKSYKDEAEDISRDLDINIFRRQKRHGAKAGIINDCLKKIDAKYVAIFDADQNPLPEFLNRLIPIMENDSKLAFVQTPQFYTNVDESRVAKAASFQQSVFYEYICEGKSSQEAMFCCGTNIVFRRKALLEVGGLDESTVTEDFATSIKLHRNKWKSLYYNHTCAFGMAPVNLNSYFIQQYRWANGTIAVLKKIITAFFRHPFSLRLNQWWEYFLSGTYYMVGLAFFILMTFPVLYLLFEVPSFFATPEVYILAFLPYIILSLSIFYFILRDRSYTARDLFTGQLLATTTFSVYSRAAFLSFLGIKSNFGITSKVRGKSIPYIRLWPQLILLMANYAAIIWGINRFIYELDSAILINCFWALYHTAVLSSIFYFNSDVRPEIGCKALPKNVNLDYRFIRKDADMEDLSNKTWVICFATFLNEKLNPGSLLMCKIITNDKQNIIFEGYVLEQSQERSRQRYRSVIGVSNISNESNKLLRKVVN
jgi:cellulose synthase (UDP-forming)